MNHHDKIKKNEAKQKDEIINKLNRDLKEKIIRKINQEKNNSNHKNEKKRQLTVYETYMVNCFFICLRG